MNLTAITASTFRTDGGAMFGLVPRPLWSRRIAPDNRHRIPQRAWAWRIDLDDGRVGLLETGCGAEERFTEKERDFHGLSPGWPLREALAAMALDPKEIDFVLLSHLHWDHVGGAGQGAERRPTFPRAKHFVHEVEWRLARSGDPLLHKSYPPELLSPLLSLEQEGRLRLMTDADDCPLPGIRFERTGGHTEGHVAVWFEGPLHLVPETGAPRDVPGAVYAGDVCPTRHHLPLVFQTSYDTFPLQTRAWKHATLPRLAEDGTALLFSHDADTCGALLETGTRGPEVKAPLDPL